MKKIDLFIRNERGGFTYSCSTTRYKTCKEAKESLLSVNPKLQPQDVKACFAFASVNHSN